MTEHYPATIACTLHDPGSDLLPFIKSTNLMSKLPTGDSHLIVCCTSKTGIDLIQFLEQSGLDIHIIPDGHYALPYQETVRTAIKQGENTSTIAYFDFDRLLHWVAKYPEELGNLLRTLKPMDFQLIGRTPRAFSTHPTCQQDTESVVNRASSRLLGFPETRDIISACWCFSKRLGARIVEQPLCTSTGFYALWPVLLWRWARTKQYVEVEGMEWETPDRFATEIKQNGYNVWLAKFQSPSQWQRRVALMNDCLEEIAHYSKISFEEKKSSKNE